MTLNLRGIVSRESATLGFGMFHFSPFIQIFLLHNNTATTYRFSKSFNKVKFRFTILTFIEISPTVWVLLLLNTWADMMQQLSTNGFKIIFKLSLKVCANNQNQVNFFYYTWQ